MQIDWNSILPWATPLAIAGLFAYVHMAVRYEVNRAIRRLNGTFQSADLCRKQHQLVDERMTLHHEMVMEEITRLRLDGGHKMVTE